MRNNHVSISLLWYTCNAAKSVVGRQGGREAERQGGWEDRQDRGETRRRRDETEERQDRGETRQRRDEMEERQDGAGMRGMRKGEGSE